MPTPANATTPTMIAATSLVDILDFGFEPALVRDGVFTFDLVAIFFKILFNNN
jgi:hypothetical protein